MASLGEVLDAVRAAIPTYTGFSAKSEIPNPYSIADNAQIYLDDGWGVIVQDGSRSAKDSPVESRTVSTERNIGVVLSRVVYDIDGQCGNVNVEAKSLFDDAATIRNNFLLDAKFGVLLGGEEIAYIGDSGVTFSISDKIKIISTQIDFTFEIVELIN